ncbi:menaquinone-dependent protoporphyrinogen IX dehydrogenase [Testudinibacter aquarius]|uniref:Protoporphyrinogen IX dehydrogenase [quinone] n=2 Tax=Testudinibacter aquarius TaxID=1524974 RepID=A0A4R3YAW2_9PAST|nr:menaquinone-dependent protoporphyrinogen IX dehydrogenase [Testudinibacter aquarius]KAE9531037.1 protoporphyrinogen oxidase [Testudinibacter aquarius]TCV89147.1 menaquinone-dependent protoporphyrinogen oxidase [Testudinibacter aquarius]
MKTLIIYASVDGQTQKIAQAIATEIQNQDQSAVVNLAALAAAEQQDLAQYDQIIIGASIRYGHFNKTLEPYIARYAELLNRKKTAFYSVNLTARKADKNTPETNAYTRKLLQRIDWQPTQSAVFAGALRYPQYRFFDRFMIRLIMKITGGETDTSKEVEYTDWEKVAEFAQRFKS